MSVTYYPYTCLSSGSAVPSGTYIWHPLPEEFSVTIVEAVTFLNAAGTSRACLLTLTGDVEQFSNHSWTNNGQTLLPDTYDGTTISYITDGGVGVTGVTGAGIESVHVDGLYRGGITVTPSKAGYEFSPTSFTLDGGSGAGVYVTFAAVAIGSPLTLEYPDDEGTNFYLNKDLFLEMRWDDPNSKPIADHTLYFAATGDPEFIPRTDRTRYSIVAYKMFLDVELDYSTTYLWFVRKDLGGGDFVDSETWSFTTMAYAPPEHSTRERLSYGEDPGGATETVPSGENNMITVQRLIAVARNKFFYEDV